MNSLEVNMLFLCVVFVGMITLLPIGNDWKRLSRSESTSLVCWMISYFLLVFSWEYFPDFAAMLIGTIAIWRMFSLIFVTVRGEGYNVLLPLMVNFVVNFGLLFLASFQHL